MSANEQGQATDPTLLAAVDAAIAALASVRDDMKLLEGAGERTEQLVEQLLIEVRFTNELLQRLIEEVHVMP